MSYVNITNEQTSLPLRKLLESHLFDMVSPPDSTAPCCWPDNNMVMLKIYAFLSSVL